LTKTASLSTTYQHARQGQSDNQIHASLTWYLHKDTTFSSTFQRQDQASSEAVQIQKNPPTGEGFSYRALLQRNDMAGQSVTVANPYVQFNSRYGVFTTEYRSPNGNSSSDSGSFAVSAAGSMVYASGAWGFSRPISDSFAIIDANSLKNVRVYFNNHEIGATDQSGKIVIPMLNSYVENLLAINDQDIPINYVLENVSERISPAWRGGARIHFNSKKTQAFSGKLVLKSKKGEQPVEFESALIQLNNSSLKFTAGRDGEFYLENLQPGEYPASLKMDQREYSFTIKIPDAEQVFVNLGTVTIETGD
jgi:outer membrane usher protein